MIQRGQVNDSIIIDTIAIQQLYTYIHNNIQCQILMSQNFKSRVAFLWVVKHCGRRGRTIEVEDTESNKIFCRIPVEQDRLIAIYSHFISNICQLEERERERERERVMSYLLSWYMAYSVSPKIILNFTIYLFALICGCGDPVPETSQLPVALLLNAVLLPFCSKCTHKIKK